MSYAPGAKLIVDQVATPGAKFIAASCIPLGYRSARVVANEGGESDDGQKASDDGISYQVARGCAGDVEDTVQAAANGQRAECERPCLA